MFITEVEEEIMGTLLTAPALSSLLIECSTMDHILVLNPLADMPLSKKEEYK